MYFKGFWDRRERQEHSVQVSALALVHLGQMLNPSSIFLYFTKMLTLILLQNVAVEASVIVSVQ